MRDRHDGFYWVRPKPEIYHAGVEWCIAHWTNDGWYCNGFEWGDDDFYEVDERRIERAAKESD